MPLRTTYTYTELEVSPSTIEDIIHNLHKAGPEYVERYFEEKEGQRIVHFSGSEVALVCKANEGECVCKGFYQPVHCPVHRGRPH